MAKARKGSGDVLNDFVLSIFRLNGFFLRAADHLTAGSGLTTARWQVLGAVLHEPLTVAAVARNMGLTRQECSEGRGPSRVRRHVRVFAQPRTSTGKAPGVHGERPGLRQAITPQGDGLGKAGA